jgi:prepilin-type N-terminal cleavage/methylation domain-containing protein
MKNRRYTSYARRPAACLGCEGGFTLVEMLIATVIVVVGLVAVAQLVPTSMMMNANNRSDGTALVIAQRQMEALRAVPLTSTTFSDPLGVTCALPLGQTCNIGDPTQAGMVGCPVVLFNNSPIIDFTQNPAATGYGFTYTDPNDPAGAVNDVRWAVVTVTSGANGPVTGRRIVVGVFRRGMKTITYPVSLDTMVSR